MTNTTQPALIYPRELTKELSHALGTMIWNSGSISAILRLDGEDIKTRAEDEQAFVLHWFITLVLEYGPEWIGKVSERLDKAVAAQKAKEAQVK